MVHLPEVAGAQVVLGTGVAVDGRTVQAGTVQADGFGYAVLALR